MNDDQTASSDFVNTVRPADVVSTVEQLKEQLLTRGILPVIPASSHVREGELVHMHISAQWDELVRESDNRRITERLRHVATGSLQVTNERLIFSSSIKHASLEYRDIIEVSNRDGYLHVEVVGPHDPYFLIEPIGTLELTEIIVNKAIARAHVQKHARLIGKDGEKPI